MVCICILQLRLGWSTKLSQYYGVHQIHLICQRLNMECQYSEGSSFLHRRSKSQHLPSGPDLAMHARRTQHTIWSHSAQVITGPRPLQYCTMLVYHDAKGLPIYTLVAGPTMRVDHLVERHTLMHVVPSKLTITSRGLSPIANQ